MKKFNKTVAFILATMMIIGLIAGCGKKNGDNTSETTKTPTSAPGNTDTSTDTSDEDTSTPEKTYDEEITIDVYSQAANFEGIIGGFGGKLWKDKFNVKINIIAPNISGEATFQTRSAAGHLGDIIMMNQSNFSDLITAGLLMDVGDLLKSNGSNFSAFQANVDLVNDNIGMDGIYAIPMQMSSYSPLEPLANPASGMMSFQDGGASYIRWDVYREIGMPEINNLDDYLDVLEKMQKAHPEGDNGQPAYAMSLFKDWDWGGMHNVLGGIPQMYGYFRSPGAISVLKYADPTDFKYQRLDDDNGYYYKALKFYFEANQRGLLDPDSATQTYGNIVQKTKDGQILSGLWPWSTMIQYNNSDRGNQENPVGFQFVPIKDAKYYNNGFNPATQWGNVIGIGAKAKDPERIMDILNWMATPEGMMLSSFGPEGMIWEYNEDGKPVRTEFGNQIAIDASVTAPEEYGGGVVSESYAQFAQIFHPVQINPETGIPFDIRLWPEARAKEDTQLNAEWREVMGAEHMVDYLKKNNMMAISPGNMFISDPWTPEMESTRSIIADLFTNTSWQMIYAEDEAQFNSLWENMKAELQAAGIEQTVQEDIKYVTGHNEAALKILEAVGQ